LIVPKSTAKFPTGRKDWKWLYPEIPEKLKALNKEGKRVVIFSNQGDLNIIRNKKNIKIK
jgi:bifunctional polynucleotide phosphatase/kinase